MSLEKVKNNKIIMEKVNKNKKDMSAERVQRNASNSLLKSLEEMYKPQSRTRIYSKASKKDEIKNY